MYKKVLFAEDIDTTGNGTIQLLEQLGIEVHQAKYCDDALLKLKKANLDNLPFDLIITDLSFEPDHRAVELKSGEELIKNIRILQPEIPILVCSIEDRSYRIKALFEHYKINAYVHKSRKSISEIKAALENLLKDQIYISPDCEHALRDKTIREIDHYDVQLIKQLAFGVAQEKMDSKFRELGISPNSKSSIEKRISKLKDCFKANNTTHLIAIAKDLGII